MMKRDDPEVVAIYPGSDDAPDLAVCRGRAPLFDPGLCEAFLRDHPVPIAAKACTQEEIEESLRYFQALLGSVGGKIGGRSRSAAKGAAARENGKLGGRPIGSRNKVKRRSENDE